MQIDRLRQLIRPRVGPRQVLPVALALALVLALAGCASVQPEPTEPRAESPVQLVDDLPDWQEDGKALLLYHMLVAEIARQQGDTEQALAAYLEAMHLTRDTRPAEQAAQLAIIRGQVDEALRALQRWDELDDDNAEVDRLLGLLYLRSGDGEQAYHHLSHYLGALDGEVREAFRGLGELLGREAQPALALQVLGELAEEYSGHASAQVALAQAALQLGERETALEAARKAGELDPDWRVPRMLEVQALVNLGRAESAIDVVERLLAEDAEDRSLRMLHARLLVNLGHRERALEEFRVLMAQRPDDLEVAYGAALLATDLDRYDEAREYWQFIAKRSYQRAEAFYRLGRIAEEEGDLTEAEGWYERVPGEYWTDAQLALARLEMERDDTEAAHARLAAVREQRPAEQTRAWVQEAHLLSQRGEPGAAAELLDEALEAEPGDHGLLYARALARVQLDDLAGAEADLRAILEDEPDDAHALNALGYTLADAGERLEEARELIGRALELEPDHPAILDSKGWVLYRQGKPEEALGYLERAWARQPDPEIGAHLGEVLWTLEREAEARAIWEAAQEIDDEHPVLQETLERLLP